MAVACRAYHDCGVCVVLGREGVLVSGDKKRPLGGVDIGEGREEVRECGER